MDRVPVLKYQQPRCGMQGRRLWGGLTLHTAGSSWLCNEPVSKAGDASVKTHLRNGRKAWRWGGGKSSREKQPCEDRRRSSGWRRTWPTAGIPTCPVERIPPGQVPMVQPVEGPTPGKVCVPEGAETCGEPTSEQGKSMRGKKQQGETAGHWVYPMPPWMAPNG